MTIKQKDKKKDKKEAGDIHGKSNIASQNTHITTLIETTTIASKRNKSKKIPTTQVLVSLPKNIGAIQISNELTSVERKIMNIVLWNATLIERDDFFYRDKTLVQDDRKFYKISMADIEKYLEWDRYTRREEIKRVFTNLMQTGLKFNILGKQKTDGGKWNIATTLLSTFITKDASDSIYYAFSDPIKDIIVKPSLYGVLDLKTQVNIDSRYTLALWEYLKGEISITGGKERLTEYVTIDEYRELISGSQTNYINFKDINRFLIKEPLMELHAVTSVQAEVEYRKTGKKVTDLRFKVREGNVSVEELDKKNKTIFAQKGLFDDQILVIESGKRKPIKKEGTKIESAKEAIHVHDATLDEDDDNVQNIKNMESEYKKQGVNKMMISYNISEARRVAFLEKYEAKYIEANIKFIANSKHYDSRANKAALIIKAIEDNYANFGATTENMTKLSKLIFILRNMINPYDKNHDDFLREQLRDYKIYKERNDAPNLAIAKKRLGDSIKRFRDTWQEIKEDGMNDDEIAASLGLHNMNEIWTKLFITKDEFSDVEVDVKNI